MKTPLPLKEIVGRLAPAYPKPQTFVPRDVFELVIWENVGYIVDDERRARTYASLKKNVGISPSAILRSARNTLAAAIEDGGMLPLMRADKLTACAKIASEICVAALMRLIGDSPEKARKIVKRFPGIADPGADKILMIFGKKVCLAPESNALRVLNRLGYGKDDGNYGRAYKSAEMGVAAQLPARAAWLTKAHFLLRRHGQEICRRTSPLCGKCELSSGCAFFLKKRKG